MARLPDAAPYAQVSGYVRHSEQFTHAVIRNAGHLLPHDQPARAMDLITRQSLPPSCPASSAPRPDSSPCFAQPTASSETRWKRRCVSAQGLSRRSKAGVSVSPASRKQSAAPPRPTPLSWRVFSQDDIAAGHASVLNSAPDAVVHCLPEHAMLHDQRAPALLAHALSHRHVPRLA
eukprot:952937-Rhodomonas_salina.1